MASGVGPGEHGEKTGIWVINVLSASLRQIRGDAEGAVPSPDGSMVAFRSGGGIFVIDANGENARSVLKLELNSLYSKLQWSPDNKRIAVLVRPIGEGESSIDAVSLADGSRTQLARLADLKTFVWFEDGRMAAVTQSRAPLQGALFHLWNEAGVHSQAALGSEMSVADMSVTAHGKHIALVRTSDQSDVFLAEFNGKTAIEGLRRLTLDDRDDRPSGWLPDGKTMLFESNRNGSLDVFRQSVQEQAAELFVGGAEDQFGAQSAANDRILYWSGSKESGRLRLMGVPLAGGSSTLLFESEHDSQFHCPAVKAPVQRCAFASLAGTKLQLASFDPVSGVRGPAKQIQLRASPAIWALASNADGVAYVAENAIHFWSSNVQWSVPEASLPGKITAIAFGPGSTADLLVTVEQTREKYLYSVKQSGTRQLAASKLHLSSALPSPDGSRMLFTVLSSSSNVWLLEDF